jgi:hypothetical protein
MEVFLEESDLIRLERVVYCALHEQDEHPTIQRPPEIFGFPISQCACPRRTQLVVTLLETLLSKADEGAAGRWRHDVFEKVCTVCFRILLP